MMIAAESVAYSYLYDLVHVLDIKCHSDLLKPELYKLYEVLLKTDEFNLIDILIEKVHVDKLIWRLLNNIDKEIFLGTEILDAIGDYLNPIIDETILFIYENHYLRTNSLEEEHFNNPAYDLVYCDQRALAQESQAQAQNLENFQKVISF